MLVRRECDIYLEMLCCARQKMTTFSTSSEQIPANSPIFINTQQLSHNPDEKSLDVRTSHPRRRRRHRDSNFCLKQ